MLDHRSPSRCVRIVTPCALELAHEVAAGDRLDAVADAVAHLEDRDVGAGRDQLLGRLAAGRAAADDDDAFTGAIATRRAGSPGRRGRSPTPMPGIGGTSGSAPVATSTTSGASSSTSVRRRPRRPVWTSTPSSRELPRLEVAEAQHLALARRPPGDLELAAELGRRAPRSRRRGRAGGRSAPPPCPPGPLPTTITRRGAGAGSTLHVSSRPASGLTAQRASLAAADEVDAGVAGDARADLVERAPPRPSRGQSGSAISARPSSDQVGVAVGDRPRPRRARDRRAGRRRSPARSRRALIAAASGDMWPRGRNIGASVTCSVCQFPAETLIAHTPASSSQRRDLGRDSSMRSHPSAPVLAVDPAHEREVGAAALADRARRPRAGSARGSRASRRTRPCAG